MDTAANLEKKNMHLEIKAHILCAFLNKNILIYFVFVSKWMVVLELLRSFFLLYLSKAEKAKNYCLKRIWGREKLMKTQSIQNGVLNTSCLDNWLLH